MFMRVNSRRAPRACQNLLKNLPRNPLARKHAGKNSISIAKGGRDEWTRVVVEKVKCFNLFFFLAGDNLFSDWGTPPLPRWFTGGHRRFAKLPIAADTEFTPFLVSTSQSHPNFPFPLSNSSTPFLKGYFNYLTYFRYCGTLPLPLPNLPRLLTLRVLRTSYSALEWRGWRVYIYIELKRGSNRKT